MADNLSIEVNDTRVIARFEAMPQRVRDALEAKAGELSLLLEAKIKGKLSDEVLNVRTGNLRRSIFSEVTASPDGVKAYAASSGDVKYAAFWEFGFSGTEEVREHTRRVNQAFGHHLKAEIVAMVRAHERRVDQAPRSYLRSSLDEMQDQIVQGLTDAVRNAFGR